VPGAANRALTAAYRPAGVANRPQPTAIHLRPVDPLAGRLTESVVRQTAARGRLRGAGGQTTAGGWRKGADRGLRAASQGGEELDGDISTPKGWDEVGLAGPPHFFFFF
jgi:hypothetical protein